ncbi:3-hydroxyanthranilic acid dioxygenase [Recurvomyces mirabilis]|uniref:3-hydroxyanthranilate 3,4-dioxygenase n=1 Tax=Recurvomyces mirabilis TaxID=574656 RepID=A0AAE1C2M0_9PEZI|nr:3-hydroxyanthranilic acid dioxygenase [Recurvomyces mirabilis]KAK5156020.1 3-hydroxyanthranilic acid dioxygenase [Recurvomyces mirabilis]
MAPSTTQSATNLGSPLNLPKWLEENSHLLKPPINNHLIYNDPLTVQIVGGPNARTDYHINSTPEFFYQYKGRMLLKTVQAPKTPDGKEEFKDIYINEGELFLLPGNVPHNPVRFEDTVGVVLELPRPEGSVDHLRWYCSGCGEKVHESGFHCTDLGTQIKAAVEEYKGDVQARTCERCGTVNESAPSEEERRRMRDGSL